MNPNEGLTREQFKYFGGHFRNLMRDHGWKINSKNLPMFWDIYLFLIVKVENGVKSLGTSVVSDLG